MYEFADINECENNNGDCVEVCTNTIGRHECSCRPGFEFDPGSTGDPLTSSGRQCIGMYHNFMHSKRELLYVVCMHADVDECSFTNGGCEQNCLNTVGSYSCSCNSGFELAMNGRDCEGGDIHASF